MTTEERDILKGWQRDICQKAAEVDPSNELDWRALWIGYAIAKGIDPERADHMYLRLAYPLEKQ